MTRTPDDQCGKPHLTRHGAPSCTGHISGSAHPERTRKGDPCRNAPRKGQRKCGYHGGASPQALAAGERKHAEAKVLTLAQRWAIPIETTPHEAILGRVTAYAGHVRFYGEQVEKLTARGMVWGTTKSKTGGDDRGTTQEAAYNIWLTAYNEASRDLVKFAAEAIRCGIEERRVRLAEGQGKIIADVIRSILDDLALNDDQLARVGEVVPRHLRLVAS